MSGMDAIALGTGVSGVAVAGATASGKSAYALDLARRHRGIIINADSMQVYRDISIISARPGPGDLAAAPHRLYGHVDGAGAHSAAAWASEAQVEIQDAIRAGALPILVGGTGLYFKSLFNGLAPVPQVPVEIRERWRNVSLAHGSLHLHAELARRDPVMAGRLRPSDAQRLARALEVIDATGVSLAAWQTRATTPLVDSEGWKRVVLEPDREVLARRIEARLAAMLAGGALDEVARLLDRRLDPALPVMKAIGVPEFGALARGEIGEAEALARAAAATRAYVKRQTTWFRTQIGEGWERIAA
jgi:tRNA dimethylallyltransferase